MFCGVRNKRTVFSSIHRIVSSSLTSHHITEKMIHWWENQKRMNEKKNTRRTKRVLASHQVWLTQKGDYGRERGGEMRREFPHLIPFHQQEKDHHDHHPRDETLWRGIWKTEREKKIPMMQHYMISFLQMRIREMIILRRTKRRSWWTPDEKRKKELVFDKPCQRTFSLFFSCKRWWKVLWCLIIISMRDLFHGRRWCWWGIKRWEDEKTSLHHNELSLVLLLMVIMINIPHDDDVNECRIRRWWRRIGWVKEWKKELEHHHPHQRE